MNVFREDLTVKNAILDYTQVEQKTRELVQSGKIEQQQDLGTTNYGLPIRHYTLGKGKKHIVVSGAMHGCEIISTEYVLSLMDRLSNDTSTIDLSEYTIHFIPMLNPEGYLISTAAIRKKIPRDMPEQDAQNISQKYFNEYHDDDDDVKNSNKNGIPLDRDPEHLRKFQQMFSDVDYSCITDYWKIIKEERNLGDKYEEWDEESQKLYNSINSIAQSVHNLYEKYTDIPKGTLQVWSANADGIDPQANFEEHRIVKRYINGEDMSDVTYYSPLRYANMNSVHPGPMNCGIDPEKGFQRNPEIRALSDLLRFLDNDEQALYAYLNYHSSGGLIYQRPAFSKEEMSQIGNDYWNRTIENYALAKLYQKKTSKSNEEGRNVGYTLFDGMKKIPREGSKWFYDWIDRYFQEGASTIDTANDELRREHPRSLLIELSPMGGNPIAPYADKSKHDNTINSNIDAFTFSLEYADISRKIGNTAYDMYMKQREKRMQAIETIENEDEKQIAKMNLENSAVKDIYRIIGTASNFMASYLSRFGRKKRDELYGEMFGKDQTR